MSNRTLPRRLIEVDLPIKRISAHARREKSIRHGHISTLHIWWARRPLAACRAVICASLWPDPADPACPQSFREAALCRLVELARRVCGQGKIQTANLCATCSPESLGRWEAFSKPDFQLDTHDASHQNVLRFALLDFIADFANWDNSTVPEYLETARALTQAAHEALGGEVGTRPLVVDPFAGGGSIPLEALRVGADAFASDLNPVAVLLNKVVLEYIPKYGQLLADEVRKWGKWVKEQAEKELAEFYPKDDDGSTPIAYLWARTITCEGPSCGAEVPLMRSLWLAKKGSRSVALRLVPKPVLKRLDFEIVQNATAKDVGAGTVRRGSATCPCCGFTTPVASVRKQLKGKRGGAADARMFCVVTTRPTQQGRFYRLPNELDLKATRNASVELERQKKDYEGSLSLVPEEQFTGVEPRRIPVPLYGMTRFCDLFSPRQLLALVTMSRLIQRLPIESRRGAEGPDELWPAVQLSLAFTLDKLADLANSLCRWEGVAECPRQLFARQAMAVTWDFAEGVPISESSGSWSVLIDRFVHVIQEIGFDWNSSTPVSASATRHPLPDGSVQAVVTDPPYYYSVPYADLADFFYVWLRRTVGSQFPELLHDPLTPKADECVQNLPHAEVARIQKSRAFYENQMRLALSECKRVIEQFGVATVVFAHSETDAWESLLKAVVESGWKVTASWPIDTEMGSRILAQRQSTLASSVHLVCRPRISEEIGDWRSVLAELPTRIHDWMPRLASEGVVGADAIFACLGPALEIFSRYSRVEKANGDVVSLKDYLEQVWAAVSKEALSMIFAGADATGFEPDARLTAIWFWTLSAGTSGNGTTEDAEQEQPDEDEEEGSKSAKVSGYVLEYDAARKIAQGLGAHLEQLTGIVQVKGDKARLLPVSERARTLFGGEEAKAPATRAKKLRQRSLFDEPVQEGVEDGGWGELNVPHVGGTVLDRLHQAMILFAAGRGEALRRFVVEEGVGRDTRFWKLAQALSALYPVATEEKRWVDGVLARKKGFGF